MTDRSIEPVLSAADLAGLKELLDRVDRAPQPELTAHHHPDGTTTLQSGAFIHYAMPTEVFEDLMAWDPDEPNNQAGDE